MAKLDLMHGDMQQVKLRLSGVEKEVAALKSTVANLSEAVAAQWENFDNHAERLYKLEHPTA
jgi:uncharacterized coiled-coil protein SlyX